MSVELLTEHHSKFLSLKGGCTGCSESTLIKMQHCWKSHITAHFIILAVISMMTLSRKPVYGVSDTLIPQLLVANLDMLLPISE